MRHSGKGRYSACSSARERDCPSDRRRPRAPRQQASHFLGSEYGRAWTCGTQRKWITDRTDDTEILPREFQSVLSVKSVIHFGKQQPRISYLSELLNTWTLACWSDSLNSMLSRNALSAVPNCSSSLSSSEIVNATRYPSGPSK